jgi:hypothetical protein
MEATKLLPEGKGSDKRARTVSGVVNSIETLEGAGFHFRSAPVRGSHRGSEGEGRAVNGGGSGMMGRQGCKN